MGAKAATFAIPREAATRASRSLVHRSHSHSQHLDIPLRTRTGSTRWLPASAVHCASRQRGQGNCPQITYRCQCGNTCKEGMLRLSARIGGKPPPPTSRGFTSSHLPSGRQAFASHAEVGLWSAGACRATWASFAHGRQARNARPCMHMLLTSAGNSAACCLQEPLNSR